MSIFSGTRCFRRCQGLVEVAMNATAPSEAVSWVFAKLRDFSGYWGPLLEPTCRRSPLNHPIRTDSDLALQGPHLLPRLLHGGTADSTRPPQPGVWNAIEAV